MADRRQPVAILERIFPTAATQLRSFREMPMLAGKRSWEVSG
jgi:hypothetical protein